MLEVRMSEENICDFCSEPKIGRRFHCQDFLMNKAPGFPDMHSKGDWMACSACGALIDAENWNGLLMHALKKFGEKYPVIPRRVLADSIRRSHDLFRAHYRKAEQ